MTEKASSGGVKYIGFKAFVLQEQIRIYGTLGAITLLFLIAGPAIDPNVLEIPNEKVTFFWGLFALSKIVIYEMVISILFTTVGYGGLDLALRFYSRTNKELNQAIDKKAKIETPKE